MQVLMHPLTLNSKLAPLRTSHNTLLSAENDYYVAHERSHTSIMLHMRCHGGIRLLHIKDAMDNMLAICCT